VSEWQLVNIALQRDGRIVYQFRHRAMFTAGMMSTAVTQDVTLAHPRDDWRIASWYSEEQITSRERV
jgi:hypothetical protein